MKYTINYDDSGKIVNINIVTTLGDNVTVTDRDVAIIAARPTDGPLYSVEHTVGRFRVALPTSMWQEREDEYRRNTELQLTAARCRRDHESVTASPPRNK